MQTLANEVEEAARAGLVALGAVAHGEGWMRVEVTPTHKSCDMVEAWVELVQDGLDALAESYPENVELMVNMVFADGKEPDPAQLPDMVDGKMNLQYFAEGGGDGGAAGEGGTEAAPAVQEPALRPAQERLARRSGALRGKPAEQPPQLSGQPETLPQEGEKPTEEKPQEQKAEKTPEEKRKAFGEMVRGEYSDIFNEVMQQAIIKAGEAVHADPKAAALRQALSEAYGVDGEDVDGLIEAVKNGKVKDDAYYEELAQQRGVSVKTAQQADKAAARAEGYAPKDGTVLSVNGKGGAVLDRAITAADVGAVEKGSGDYLKGNRGNYRLRIEQRGEWKGLTVCAHWHTPGASAATLVENGVLTVPAAVTAMPGVGCITFEGTDGSRTVTSADVRCKVCANSGTAEGAMPAPDTPAWEALVGLLGTGGITTAEKRELLAILRLLAAGNDVAMAAYDRLAALWSAPQPEKPENKTTARLSLAVLGRMILGRS